MLSKLYILPFLLIPTFLVAQITTETSFVYFDADSAPVRNLAVYNSHSEDTVLVEVEVTKINTSGEKDAKDAPTSDLIVSPKRFTMPPGTSRVSRIILRKPAGEKESAYRINFIPRAVTDDEGKPPVTVGGRGVKLRVLTGVGAIIFAEPKDPKAILSWEDKGSSMVIKNTGNINVYVDDVYSCINPDSDTTCTWIKEASKRMYPGYEKVIEKSKDKIIKITRRVNNDSKKIILKGTGEEVIEYQ